MSYINYRNIINCRNYVNGNVKNADTFAGLIILLISGKLTTPSNRYLISDMSKFSEIVDNAFYLKIFDGNTSYD
jgi:hypothetical protein